ncbi:MAG: YtxH domain-containing protein [Anaerolineales bacterium]
MSKTVNFLGGLAVGLGIGGALALLFAPASGQELQEQLQEHVNQLVEEGKAAAEARRLELEAQLEAFKQGRPLTSIEPTVKS